MEHDRESLQPATLQSFGGYYDSNEEMYNMESLDRREESHKIRRPYSMENTYQRRKILGKVSRNNTKSGVIR